jgi:crotonobetainyl-CoA:carnitine CoA-transferase CaiB-like acyl-CoA transferase
MHMSLFQQWETLVEWMDSEGMAEDLKDEKYKGEEFRQNHRDHIIEILQRWTKTHTRNELFESGQLMRFPWAPVYSPKEVSGNPQLKSRGFLVEVGHPEMGTFIQYPGAPYKFDGRSLGRRKRAPLIGEDNLEIYQRELGLSEEELKRLSSIHTI